MCQAIALPHSEVPVELLALPDLSRRVHIRNQQTEVRFYYRDRAPLVPVWYAGELRLLRWGNRQRRGRLPPTGWTWRTTVEAGGWAHYGVEMVEIPALFGWDNGIWFAIRQGIRGLVAADADGTPTVYMLCQPATHYYRVMTRSDRMPVLVGEMTI